MHLVNFSSYLKPGNLLCAGLVVSSFSSLEKTAPHFQHFLSPKKEGYYDFLFANKAKRGHFKRRNCLPMM